MTENLRNRISEQLQSAWYGKTGLTLALRPLTWIYTAIVVLRKFAYRISLFRAVRLETPVIVVGNLTVGGTGKTPLVIWLANFLKQSGYKPGVISRGYGGRAQSWPQQVRPDADPIMVGDEALVISRRTGCPMAVGPDRVAAAKALLQYADVDVIISDDGLQHYRLDRNIEILVIDGIRRFGNGMCLPAGPLREPAQRQQEVDFIVTNGIAAQGEHAMKLRPGNLVNLLDGRETGIDNLKSEQILAVAGIGHPDRFFNFLRSHGLRLTTRAYPDHFLFRPDSIPAQDVSCVIMTEKDAVKCRRFARENWWYLPIDVELSEEFGVSLINKLKSEHG